MHTDVLDSTTMPVVNLIGNISGSFALAATSLSKTSFALTLMRITTDKTRLFVWFIVITTNLANGTAIIVIWNACRPVQKIWIPSFEGECWDEMSMLNYYIFASCGCSPRLLPSCLRDTHDMSSIIAYSAAMDFTMALLPSLVLRILPMNASEKLGVIMCMSLGVL
jgi:hypothetical protein